MGNQPLFRFTLTLILSIVFMVSVTQAIEVPDPVNWWKFDESGYSSSCIDSMGTAHGTLSGNWGISEGRIGRGIDFYPYPEYPEYQGYMEAEGYKGITGGNSRTCTAWIKTTNATGQILTWGDEGNGRRWIIRVNDGGQLRAEVLGGNIIGTTIINDGNWHHIAVVLANDGSPNIMEAQLYVDGLLETISSYVAYPVNTGAVQNVQIGVYSLAKYYFFGSIDEVKIYNVALSSAQVAYVATVPFGGGNGSTYSEFYISNARDLYELSVRPDYWTYSFRLTSNIDLTVPDTPQPLPIGMDAQHPFSGNFNGFNYTIKGVQNSTNSGAIGLFGFVSGRPSGKAVIRNLYLTDAEIAIFGNVSGSAGILCGFGVNCEILNCRFENCSVLTDPEGHILTGGLAGELQKSIVKDIFFTNGYVYGGVWTGGIVGRCERSIFSNCKFYGQVSGTQLTGGLAGEMLLSSVSLATIDGDVYGQQVTGGMVGRCDRSSFYNSSSESDIQGNTSTGGFAGQCESVTVNKCCSIGNVSGDLSTGGFVGAMASNSSMKDCFSMGQVTGNQTLGGFAGTVQPSCTLEHCYAASLVSGVNQVGAFTGYQEQFGGVWASYIGCFWDTAINPGLPGISNCTDAGLTGKTTTEMKSPDTYLNTGWDFSGETVNGQAETWFFTAATYPHLDLSNPYPGAGTADSPYLIYVKEHLFNSYFESYYSYRYFKLMADIDFQGGCCPTLFQQYFLRGEFDGNHKSIKNLYMEDQQGLFGGLSGEPTVLMNLTLINPTLVNNRQDIYCGLLVESVQQGSVIDNCHIVNGKIINYNPSYSMMVSGGLVGLNSGTIANCSFAGTITGDYYAGGISGVNFETGWIANCHADVLITGQYMLGGVCGYNTGVITECSSKGSVSTMNAGTSYCIGGLVGYNSGGTTYDEYGSDRGSILDSYSTCDVFTSDYDAGGLVGECYGGLIFNCYATGAVTGYSYVGGLVGTIVTYTQHTAKGMIENCFSTGNVSGNNRVGGFAGESGSSHIRNCYSTGSVTGSTITGGFVGTNYPYSDSGYGEAVIENCYSIGKVTAGAESGGLVGRHRNQSVRVYNSFWDTQTSGWTFSSGGTGKTTAQMQTQGTFTNWDFTSIWTMGAYPVLQWELNPLQAQIDAAVEGSTIVVQPGIYQGKLYFRGKNIILTSTDPTNPEVVANTILDGAGLGPVITFKGTENSTCVLDGFTITGGNNTVRLGGGICGNDCGAGIRHCVFKDNKAAAYPGGGIWGIAGAIEHCIFQNNHATYGGGLAKCSGVIANCLIVDNVANSAGSALHNCDGFIRNCTIINTSVPLTSLINISDGLIENCIMQTVSGSIFSASTAVTQYSCWPQATGLGNLSADPLFVDPANGDYRLLPDSPCIDAGNPASDYSLEPLPNGGRVNMGAYGNTPQATQSPNGGLVPLGFEIISKTRTGRTVFDYQLAVIVRNTNPYAMNEVTLRLLDMDEAVIAVSDDQVVMDSIGPGEIQTSQDTFSLTIDRSQTITTGTLTWELTYSAAGESEPTEPLLLTMFLSQLDFVPGDITRDGAVNLKDFAVLSRQWQDVPGIPSADIALGDNYVGIEDLLYLAEHWLH